MSEYSDDIMMNEDEVGMFYSMNTAGLRGDTWIEYMAVNHNMIDPFINHQVRFVNGRRVISYGLSSYGFDVQVSDEYKIFTNLWNGLIDPKDFNEDNFVDYQGPQCIIPPNSFALARTVQYLRMPRNVTGITLRS